MRYYGPCATSSAARVITAKFPGTCNLCGAAVTPGERIAYLPGNISHADKNDCHAAATAKRAAKAAQAAVAHAIAPAVKLDAVVALLAAAKNPKLKYPKVSLASPGGGVLNLNLASERSSVPGAVNVLLGEEWLGRVTPAGDVHGKLARNTELVAFLVEVASSKEKLVAAAKVYAQLTSACSFCQTELTDAGSIEVGYGPKCAKNYGLPHRPKGVGKVIELVDDEAAAERSEDSVDRADAYYSQSLGF